MVVMDHLQHVSYLFYYTNSGYKCLLRKPQKKEGKKQHIFIQLRAVFSISLSLSLRLSFALLLHISFHSLLFV